MDVLSRLKHGATSYKALSASHAAISCQGARLIAELFALALLPRRLGNQLRTAGGVAASENSIATFIGGREPPQGKRSRLPYHREFYKNLR